MLLLDDYRVDTHRVLVRENYLQKMLSRKLEIKFGLPNIVWANQQRRSMFILGMKSDERKGIGNGLLETKVHWLSRPMPLSTNMQLVNHNLSFILASIGQSF